MINRSVIHTRSLLSVGPQPLPTGSAALIYEATERCAIQVFVFANTTASLQQVTLNKLTPTGSVSVGNQFIPTTDVPIHDVIPMKVPIILNAGDKIFGLATGEVNVLFNVYNMETALAALLGEL